MSKIFKSAVSHREVRIWPTDAGFAIAALDDVSNECTSTQLAPTDAPAIALAILEAAGVEPLSEHYGDDTLPATSLSRAAHYLSVYANQVNAAAKEAADQKQLEEEAWQLFVAVKGTGTRKSWGEVSLLAKSEWVSAARKARELHGSTK